MKPKKSFAKSGSIALIAGALFALPLTSTADTFALTNTTADAFVASGPSGGLNLATNNYGGAGTLAISSASTPKGEFDSVIKFNTANAISQFNTTYGAGNWTLTGLTLMLASNTGIGGGNPGNTNFNTINGGSFGINWLPTDSWVEGSGTPGTPTQTGLTFNSLPSLLAGGVSLGTYTYTPPGNNVYANYSLLLDGSLTSDVLTGGDVSLYFYAADNQISYLFNSKTFNGGGRPQLMLTVEAVPEPAAMPLLAAAFGVTLCLRGWKRK